MINNILHLYLFGIIFFWLAILFSELIFYGMGFTNPMPNRPLLPMCLGPVVVSEELQAEYLAFTY